jgi:N-acetylneuraminic acid mutarotase
LVYWGGFYECFDASTCDHVWRDDLYHYDLDADKWKSISATSTTGTFPRSRAFFAANAWTDKDNDKEYAVIFGGIHYNVTLSEFAPFGDIWLYSAGKKQWTLVTPVSTVTPGLRIAPNVAIYKNDMYVFGGLLATFQIANDLWKFNLETKVWTQLIADGVAGSPGPRYLSSFRLDKEEKNIILMGGNIPVAASGAQDGQTWSYSIQTGNWTRLADMNRGRIHNAAEVIDGKFITAFGDAEHQGNDTGCRTPEASAGQSPINEVQSLNLNTNVWSVLNVTGGPGPLKRVMSARVGNRMYVTGGYNYVCPGGPETVGNAVWNTGLYSVKLG